MKRIIGILLLLTIWVSAKSQDLIINSISKDSTDRYSWYEGVINISNNDVADVVDGFVINGYLSIDSIQGNEDDTILFSASVGDLGAGMSADVPSCCRTTDSQPGVYTLFVHIDSYQNVSEKNEDNNIFAVPNFIVKPADVDFAAGELTLEYDTMHSQDILHVSVEVLKSGTTDVSEPVITTLYLSADSVVDQSDRWLTALGTGFLGADEPSSVQEIMAGIPNVPPGTYYIIASVDDIEALVPQFDETNESNNIALKQIVLLPHAIDLEVTDMQVTTSIKNGIAGFSYRVWNHGQTPAGGFRIDVTVSKDSILGNGDENYVETIFPVYERIEPGSFKDFVNDHGRGYPPGDYYLFININPSFVFAELDSTNNLAVKAVHLEDIAAPVLVIDTASFVKNYGELIPQMEMHVTIRNTSDTRFTGPQSFNLSYLNKYEVMDGFGGISDTLDIGPGESVSLTWKFDLYFSMNKGDYTLFIYCNTYDECVTSGYNFPFAIGERKFVVNGVVKGEDDVPITKGELLLYKRDWNGVITLADQKTLDGSNEYSFEIPQMYHMLHFIPDTTAFPDYVPTIFSKALLADDASFIIPFSDTTIDMEVIKIVPLPDSTAVIEGTVSEETIDGGRKRQLDYAVGAGIPVILLSSSNEVVGVTYTDASGHFKFEGLPPAEYKVVSVFGLDQVQMTEPFDIDITTENKSIEMIVTGQGIEQQQEVFLEDQIITFNQIPAKTYKDPVFTLSLSTNSGLPISLLSSNTSVATIENGVVTIHNAGATTITATRDGNARFNPASPVERVLTVNKASQLITFDEIEAKSIEDADFFLDATSTSELDVSYTSSNTAVATMEGTKVIIQGGGSTNITAAQIGDNNYLAATPVTRILVVELVLAVDEKESGLMVYPNPSTGLFNIENKNGSEVKQLSVIDNSGKQRVYLVSDQVDLTEKSSGVYYLKVKTSKGYTIFRLIKK